MYNLAFVKFFIHLYKRNPRRTAEGHTVTVTVRSLKWCGSRSRVQTPLRRTKLSNTRSGPVGPSGLQYRRDSFPFYSTSVYVLVYVLNTGRFYGELRLICYWFNATPIHCPTRAGAQSCFRDNFDASRYFIFWLFQWCSSGLLTSSWAIAKLGLKTRVCTVPTTTPKAYPCILTISSYE